MRGADHGADRGPDRAEAHLHDFVSGHRLGEVFFAPFDVVFSIHEIALADLLAE